MKKLILISAIAFLGGCTTAATGHSKNCPGNGQNMCSTDQHGEVQCTCVDHPSLAPSVPVNPQDPAQPMGEEP